MEPCSVFDSLSRTHKSIFPEWGNISMFEEAAVKKVLGFSVLLKGTLIETKCENLWKGHSVDI